VAGEAPDVSDPNCSRCAAGGPGYFVELARHFGGGARLREALKELQARLYAA